MICQSPFPRNNQMRDCKEQGGLRYLKACLFHSHAVRSLLCHGGRGSSKDVVLETQILPSVLPLTKQETSGKAY